MIADILKQMTYSLQPKAERVMGFRLARELDDCGKDIMAVFGVADFYRDYENVWEWVESREGQHLDVNIARPHNGKTGDYDVPVIVKVSGAQKLLTDEILFSRAQQLADKLCTEVWLGRPIFNDKNDSRYDFEIEKRFQPIA
jgi:hypothetical protein